jgi:uncharacterized protein
MNLRVPGRRLCLVSRAGSGAGLDLVTELLSCQLAPLDASLHPEQLRLTPGGHGLRELEIGYESASMSNDLPDVYECDGCGACCCTYPIFASSDDAALEPRITGESQKLPAHLETPRWAYRLFPLPFHDRCCFLDLDCRCTVYSTRPQVCREFAAGSEPCQQARARKGLPVLAPVNTGWQAGA